MKKERESEELREGEVESLGAGREVSFLFVSETVPLKLARWAKAFVTKPGNVNYILDPQVEIKNNPSKL